MIILNPSQQRQPIGGHHFPESKGPVIRGDTMAQVVKKLEEFRVINGIPLGHPEKEVLEYYAKSFPYMVIEGDDKAEAPKSEQSNRFAHWIRTVWKNPPKKFLPEKEAERRWNICKTCPFNTKLSTDKDPESLELSRRQFILSRGMNVPKEVGFCSLHRFPIGVVCYLESPKGFSAKKTEDSDEPRCWV